MEWLSLLAEIVIAGVAVCALYTWRKQLGAEKQLSFIDELTDTVHEFILMMAAPTHQLEFAKTGIQSHEGAAFGFEQYENAAAIAFITKHGVSTQRRISEDLARITPIVGKMNSLVAKGQVMGFDNYEQCQEACRMLVWSYNQLEAFCAIIGNPNWNWENPVVQNTLNKLPEIDADQISANLGEQNATYLAFAKEVYQRVLSPSHV